VLKQAHENSKVTNKGENILPIDIYRHFKNELFFSQSDFICLWFSVTDLAEAL